MIEGLLKGSVCANVMGPITITDEANSLQAVIESDPDKSLKGICGKAKDYLASWVKKPKE